MPLHCRLRRVRWREESYCVALQLVETCLNEVTFIVGSISEGALIEPDCPVEPWFDMVVPVTSMV